MANVKETVITAIENITGREDINEDMVFGTDIVLTSVNAMRLIYELETACGIDSIPLEIVYEVETVKQLIEEIEKL